MIFAQTENAAGKTAKKPNALAAISTHELDLPRRIENRLNAARIETVGALVERTETELLAVKNLSRKSLEIIKARLESVGLAFRGA